jgi:hypothetical protein
MTFRPRTAAIWIFAVVCLGMAACSAIAAWKSRPLGTADLVVLIVFLVILCGFGLPALFYAILIERDQYVVSERGIALPSARSFIEWPEVRSMTLNQNAYVLWCPDGTSIALPAMTENAQFKALVEKHLLEVLLPRYEKRLLENKRVDFGPFAIDDGEVHYGPRRIPFDGQVRIVLGEKKIELRHDGKSWAVVNASEVNDAIVLVELINRAAR